MARAKFFHEFEAGFIGEADVGDDNVEGFTGGDPECGGSIFGGDDGVVEGGEEAGHVAAGVVVIFDEEDAEGSGGFGFVVLGEVKGVLDGAGMVGKVTVKMEPLFCLWRRRSISAAMQLDKALRCWSPRPRPPKRRVISPSPVRRR